MAVIGEAEVRVVPDTRGFGKQVEEDIEDPVRKSAKRMGVALAAAFGAQQIGSFFKDAVDAASAAEEATSKVGVVFGESSDAVLQFADNATEAFGQSSNQALEATGTFGNLFRAVGLAEDQSADFATTLTGLASDLASFNDTDVDDALTALRSGLVGETEPLKRFGVNLNEATLKAKALELGLSDGKATLDSAAKAQAAYSLILEQTSLAQGDFARTADGLANSQRTLAAEFENAKTEIGQGLLPVASELVGIASDELIPLITELADVAVPLLSTAFEVAGPFIGTTTTILEALLPVVEVIGEGLEKIPTPLLQIVTAAVAFNKVAGPLGGGLKTLNDQFRITQLRVNSAREALASGGGLSGAANAGAAGISKLNVAVAGATVALGAGVAIYQAATAESKRYDEAVQDVAKALDEATDSQQTFNDVLNDSTQQLDELNQTELDILDLLGVTVDDLRDAIAAGEDITAPLIRGLQDLGVAVDENSTKSERFSAIYESDLPRAAQGAAVEINNLFDSIEDLDNEVQAGSQLFLDRAVATGTLTASQEEAVEAAIRLGDETGNYAAAAASVEDILGPVVEETEALGTNAAESVDPVIDLTDAISELEQGLIDSTTELDNYLTAVSDAFGVELDYEESILAVSDAVDEVTSKTLDLIAARGDQGTMDLVIAEEELAEATRERNRVFEDAESTQLDKLKADEAVADAQREVAEVTQATAEIERELADAQRDAVDVFLASEEAIRAKSDAETEGLSATERAAAANAAVLEELDKVAATLDPNSPLAQNLEEYRGQLDGVTGEFVAQVDANTEVARAELDGLAAEYQNRAIQVPVELVFNEDPFGRNLAGGTRFFAEGFYGTTSGPMPFVAGEAGPEDVLVVPTAIGGIAKVVSDLASQLAGSGGAQAGTGGGVVISPGAIQVVAGPDSSPQAIAREVIDRLGFELTVRGDR